MLSSEPSAPNLAPKTAPTRRAASVWFRSVILVGALAALMSLSIGVARRWWPSDAAPPSCPADNDPRRTYDTPFLNVRPEVQYVGDDACGKCHAGHVAAFHEHPMGRSLAPVAQADLIERFGPDSRTPFEARGATFQVTRHDQRVFHKEIYCDAQGKEFAAREAEVHFVLGSGRQGRSYLIN